MTKQVTWPRALAKSANVRIRNQAGTAASRKRNQIETGGNQISLVMLKVKSLLPPVKAAQHLAILIDEPISNCQKLLAGFRTQNSAVLSKLLRSHMGRDVLFALMGDATPDWFSKYRKQLDVNAARRQLEEAKRSIEALQAEAAE